MNPQKLHAHHMALLTHQTDRMVLFVADHKIEHLNADFYGPHLDPTIANPEHLFSLACQADIGGFATHLGLIARYGRRYPSIPYIAKLTGTTNLIPAAQQDPYSAPLWTVDDVLKVKKQHRLSLCGIGITIYIGSAYESDMLAFAAQEIAAAHENGLIACLWIYPRGTAVANPLDANLIAGAAGIAACLGADIVKVHPPAPTQHQTSSQLLKQATVAAGTTAVICSGGTLQTPEQLIQATYDQMHEAGTRGIAVGRNLFQRPLPQAILLAKALAALVYHGASVDQALKILPFSEETR